MAIFGIILLVILRNRVIDEVGVIVVARIYNQAGKEHYK
jgi:hypothetical protein